LLNRITPIIATSSSTETISNGRTYCVNKNLPSAAVSPSIVGDALRVEMVASDF
jgi:hypothetical protein